MPPDSYWAHNHHRYDLRKLVYIHGGLHEVYFFAKLTIAKNNGPIIKRVYRTRSSLLPTNCSGSPATLLKASQFTALSSPSYKAGLSQSPTIQPPTGNTSLQYNISRVTVQHSRWWAFHYCPQWNEYCPEKNTWHPYHNFLGAVLCSFVVFAPFLCHKQNLSVKAELSEPERCAFMAPTICSLQHRPLNGGVPADKSKHLRQVLL